MIKITKMKIEGNLAGLSARGRGWADSLQKQQATLAPPFGW
jgi:hypothetical protein